MYKIIKLIIHNFSVKPWIHVLFRIAINFIWIFHLIIRAMFFSFNSHTCLANSVQSWYFWCLKSLLWLLKVVSVRLMHLFMFSLTALMTVALYTSCGIFQATITQFYSVLLKSCVDYGWLENALFSNFKNTLPTLVFAFFE